MATKELIRQRLKVSNEPIISQDNYSVDMMKACNWYNTEYSTKDYKSWFLTHFGRKRMDFPHTEVRDSEYRSAGVLARIAANGNILSDKHSAFLESEYQRIRQIAIKTSAKPVVVSDVPEAKKPSIQERMDEKVSEFLGEFAALIDELVTTGSAPKVDNLVTTMGISGPMSKKIVDKVKKQMEEIQELLEGKDKQLVEGYSNLKKSEQKKLLAVYESLMTRLQQAKVSAAPRKRKVKVIPAGVLVKNLKYLKEHTEYQLKSVIPANIVGASEVWIFNSKNKKLQCYVAQEGSGISVKGTSLINWDVTKSVSRTVRKPEQLQVLNNVGKRTYSQFYKTLKTTESQPNGRTNADCIIMAAFK